jgi:RND family efflux transporter MFP subunit
MGETAGAQASTLLPSQELVGVVMATRTLDLGPKVDGRLQELKVRLGERVAANQIVAALETDTLEFEVASRQASLKAAEAELNRSTILRLQAQQRLEREKRIKDFSAAEAVETAENAMALASADQELAKARAAEAQTRLAQAASQLENAKVRAPFAGVISEIYLYPGTQVGRSSPVVRLVSEEFRLRFAVPISQASMLRPGAPVSARLETLGLVLTGFVENISPEVDQSSRLLKAEARLEIPAAHKGRIPSGLLAVVNLSPSGSVATAPTP